MLGYLFSFTLGLSPALQAVFDLPLQLALQRAVLAGFLAWLFLGAYRRGLPRALAGKDFYPLWAAAGLTLLSLAASPFRGYAFNEWGNYGAGLLIFLGGSLLGREERGAVDRAVTWGAWLVFAVSLLQVFALGNFLWLPPLTNLNALALYALLVLPLALERRAWPLAAALVIMVIWTQSLGAALALLAAAGAYAVSRPGGREFRENAFLLAALAIMAAAVFYLLNSDSVAGRLAWWRGAWEMFLARPLSGFGFSSYTWAQSAFQGPGAFREYSIYAHNYYLEFLAENGLPAALAWFWLVFSALRRRQGLAKYALIAALAHSLVDFGLSVPANFWLFCWLLSVPAADRGELRPSRSALNAALLAALLLSAALLHLDYRSLAFDKARRRAYDAAASGGFAAAEAELAPALRTKLFRAPALELLGGLEASGGRAFMAAARYEAALLENRYSAAAWSALRALYSAPGLEAEAAGLEGRRREVYK